MVYRLESILKERLWGNKEISILYDMPFNIYAPIGEAWILSALGKNNSPIINIKNNKNLKDIFNDNKDIVKKGFDGKQFPLLIKYISSNKPLSIQVHPSTKNEFWHILECGKNSYIYYGFKKDVDEEKVRKAIEDGSICNLLNKVHVKPGDKFYIPSGTIHAIGGDIFLIEVQQSCDVTYRIYDYKRLDQNGEPRELHIKQALDCINYQKTNIDPKLIHSNLDDESIDLISCPYFKVKRIKVRGTIRLKSDESSFHFVSILKGYGILNTSEHILQAKKTDGFFITAGHGEYSITGKCDIIVATL